MAHWPECTPMPVAPAEPPEGRPLKVCHLASSNWGCRWMVEQLRELRGCYGHEVAAIINEGPGPLLEDLRANSISTFHWDFRLLGSRNVVGVLSRIVRLGLLFKRERFDVVQSHLLASMIMCRLAGWLFDVPVRVSMIPHPAHLEAPITRWIDKSTCWMETALVASCELTRNLYRKIGAREDKLDLIYYGPEASRFEPETVMPVNLRSEYGWGQETRLIGNIAYFYWAPINARWSPPGLTSGGFKGQEDIIRAAPLVLSEFPEARFLLIGSAPSEEGQRFLDSMKELVSELGLEDKVVFPGYRPDTPGIIRTLDVSIQAALMENLGGTVESLLLERPVVATRVGGMVDSVRDGETGVLVEPCDPESLAAGILRLLRDPEKARQLGKAGRRLMLERFTLRHAVAGLDALYKRQLYAEGKRKPGYRLWVTLSRAPVFLLVVFNLWLRVSIIEKLSALGNVIGRKVRRVTVRAVRRPA